VHGAPTETPLLQLIRQWASAPSATGGGCELGLRPTSPGKMGHKAGHAVLTWFQEGCGGPAIPLP